MSMNEKGDLPYVSVSISEYDPSEIDRLKNCIKSILEQDYSQFEVILISESEEVSEEIRNNYSEDSNVSVVDLENEEGGLSAARNTAIQYASGDVIAYIDSDARAKDGWLKNIGETYRDKNVLAVGGHSTPNWKSKRPAYLPDEFLWMVGSTYKGHPEHGSIMRNGIGCNMTFNRTVLEQIKFSENLGKNHGYNLQGEEPELGVKMQEQFNTGVYYNSDADISHDVDKVQTRVKWLSKRAYLQGVSKSIIEHKSESSSLNTDKSFLNMIIKDSIPDYAKETFLGLNKTKFFHLVGTLYFTFLVGMGYIIGIAKMRTGLLDVEA